MVVIIKKSLSLYLVAALILVTAFAGYLYMPDVSEASYVDSTTNTGTTEPPSVAVPTGVQAGDIVILVATADYSSADFQTADWPTGFTELSETNNTLDGQSTAIGWKRLTGADSGSYTFGDIESGGFVWITQAYAFRGRHATDPPTTSTATNNSANSNPVTITATGVTAVEGDDLLFISAPDVNTTGVGNGHSSWISPFSEKEDAENGFSNLAGATSENVSAGATGDKTVSFAITSGDSGWAAFLVRIPSAPAAPPATSGTHVNIRGGGAGGGGVRLRGGPASGGSQTPAYVQSASNVEYFNSDANVATSFSSQNVTTGNLIAVYVSWSDATTLSLSSVDDNCGNIYTLVGSPVSGANDFEAQGAYAKNVTGGSMCTITATLSGATSNKTIAVHEISGVDTNSPLDGNVATEITAGAGTDALTSGNWTTSTNGDYIFGAMMSPNQNGGTITAGTNYARRVYNTSSSVNLTTEDRIQTTASASTVVTFTNSGFGDALIVGMAFKAASGGGTSGSVKFR